MSSVSRGVVVNNELAGVSCGARGCLVGRGAVVHRSAQPSRIHHHNSLEPWERRCGRLRRAAAVAVPGSLVSAARLAYVHELPLRSCASTCGHISKGQAVLAVRHL